MLGVLQQFLYYCYQKLSLIWPQSSNCLRYTLSFQILQEKILPQVAGEMVTESVIPVKDA